MSTSTSACTPGKREREHGQRGRSCSGWAVRRSPWLVRPGTPLPLLTKMAATVAVEILLLMAVALVLERELVLVLLLMPRIAAKSSDHGVHLWYPPTASTRTRTRYHTRVDLQHLPRSKLRLPALRLTLPLSGQTLPPMALKMKPQQLQTPHPKLHQEAAPAQLVASQVSLQALRERPAAHASHHRRRTGAPAHTPHSCLLLPPPPLPHLLFRFLPAPIAIPPLPAVAPVLVRVPVPRRRGIGRCGSASGERSRAQRLGETAAGKENVTVGVRTRTPLVASRRVRQCERTPAQAPHTPARRVMVLVPVRPEQARVWGSPASGYKRWPDSRRRVRGRHQTRISHSASAGRGRAWALACRRRGRLEAPVALGRRPAAAVVAAIAAAAQPGRAGTRHGIPIPNNNKNGTTTNAEQGGCPPTWRRLQG